MPLLDALRQTMFPALLLLAVVVAGPVVADDEPPRTLILDGQVLAQQRQRVLAGDEALAPALEALLERADLMIDNGPWSVTDNAGLPPSGDAHDYQSIGPYWWPNPDTEDGLPYVRRDGQTNPERRTVGDADAYRSMMTAATTLAQAWYFTGEDRYAQRAALLLRTWYIDPDTRMNPNLQYAQAIPGRTEGRGIGIVDAWDQPMLIDAVGLLQGSEAWTEEDQAALVRWFDQMLDWLLTSSHGRDESNTRNNHATQYDVQVVSYALFVGREDVAERVLGEVQARRVATQVREDGSQPHELGRTRSWDYSCFNAMHFARLARLGGHVGIDLWQRGSDGPTIGDAIDYLLPYAAGDRAWGHRQIRRFNPGALRRVLVLAYPHDETGRYAELLTELVEEPGLDRLLYDAPYDAGASPPE